MKGLQITDGTFKDSTSQPRKGRTELFILYVRPVPPPKLRNPKADKRIDSYLKFSDYV